MARYSATVAAAFSDVSIGDYYVDPDGHWLTLKPGFNLDGGQIVHEWTAAAMVEARKRVEETPRRRQNRSQDGRYSFDGDMTRLCACGHSLGDHAAAAPHDCMHPLKGPGDPCGCNRFRLKRGRRSAAA